MTLIVKARATGLVSLPQLMQMPLDLDVWEVSRDSVVLRAAEGVLERLEGMGYTVEQLATTEQYLSTFATDAALAGYHSITTLEQDLRQLHAREPDVTELREIGRSVEGRPIWALGIGEQRGNSDEQRVDALFLGCHHAREWISVEVTYRLAEHLVTSANTAPIQYWLQTGKIWVVPMVNPDGHEHSRTSDRLWRKNRRLNTVDSIGVDLNRNYGYMWGTLDANTSSRVPSHETYVGPRAFSEPETQAVRDLVACQPIFGVITYHSYSQVILYPWGYVDEPISHLADGTGLADLAVRMQQGIQEAGGNYTSGRASELYAAAGDATDWTYGEYGIPSLTIKLPPRSHSQGGFILPASEIARTWEESLPAALEFMAAVNATNGERKSKSRNRPKR